VNVVVRRDRSGSRAWVIAAAVAILGIAGFWFMRSGDRAPETTRQAAAEPASTSVAPPPSAAPAASTSIAPQAAVAVAAASTAPRPAQSWQAALQPAVVAATRVDSLSAYQVQMEHWSCEGEKCVGSLRIPLNTDAGRKHDIAAPAQILDVLQKKMAPSDIRVAMKSFQPDSQGIAVALEFSANASRQGRFYTDEEIASIRMESVLQGSKMSCKDTAH